MLDYPLIEAVAAVLRTGSFEKAARQLNLTQSAISQRVKLLEERLGTVLIVRGQPCLPTTAGRRLRRHAEEVGLLEQTLRTELGTLAPADRPATLRIAVNADSLASWFIDAMAGIKGRLFDLLIDDEDRCADWLRRGEVSAAVSAHPVAVQGCRVWPLGALRYVATASPAFAARWFAEGIDGPSLRRAPAMAFSYNDELQVRWIANVIGEHFAPPAHWLPSSQAFVDATLAGIGWSMNPLCLVAEHLAQRRLVELLPDTPLDVPLYWQWSRAVEPVLRDVTASVLAAARQHLVEPSPAAPDGGPPRAMKAQ